MITADRGFADVELMDLLSELKAGFIIRTKLKFASIDSGANSNRLDCSVTSGGEVWEDCVTVKAIRDAFL